MQLSQFVKQEKKKFEEFVQEYKTREENLMQELKSKNSIIKQLEKAKEVKMEVEELSMDTIFEKATSSASVNT